MEIQPPQTPKKYHPRGFEIIHEDRDLIVGIKASGFLSVAAKWNKDDTIHSALNWYVRKGQAKSRKCVYVVHRLDQDTTGVMVYAKSEEAQRFLKDHWKQAEKIYYAVVHGHPAEKSGTIESYLSEDEDYVVHSSESEGAGKLAQTEYEVIKESPKFSLVHIRLLTGRKNQIRVHMAELGHPVVGDVKYGNSKFKHLMLHSQSLSIIHPFTGKRLKVQAPLPDTFNAFFEADNERR